MNYKNTSFILIVIILILSSCKNKVDIIQEKTDKEKLYEIVEEFELDSVTESNSKSSLDIKTISVDELRKSLERLRDTLKGSGTGYIDPKTRKDINE